ncbi:MAG: isoprenylcysteine carboxylmethyltransferase family protein [Candidatus Roizmanbacteria bacterium]|nr:isoprenylcysteine carboxylmethyltransferase family protein [Candidatus Roizmanbacteria bacterium]MCR4312852.1 isoprenylcysteine carboxylmethyltransferase family protein [Candidatus Roizmanbacteria bacterium]
MDNDTLNKLKRRIFMMFPISFLFLASILMLSAWSLRFWQGWIFCFVIFIPIVFVVNYFAKHAPIFLERRMKYKEREMRQKAMMKISSYFTFLGLLIPGLDFRFGWSTVPVWLVLASDVIILASYFFVFISFRENIHTIKTAGVFKRKIIVETGPYGIVRHPMYAAFVPMFLFIPFALGSFWAVFAFFPIVTTVIFRILKEEKVMLRDLTNYKDYCKKVPYRLIPFVW